MFINSFLFNTRHGLNSLSVFTPIMYKNLTTLGEQTLPHKYSKAKMNNLAKISNLFSFSSRNGLKYSARENVAFYMKQDFSTLTFSHPTLLMVKHIAQHHLEDSES